MKGKKIALGILATACTIGGAVALFGCSDKNEGHEHDYATEFTPIMNNDGTSEYHAHKCKDETCNVATDSAAHDYEETSVAATCTLAGSKTSTCKVCHYTKTETVGEALGHDWGAWEITAENMPAAAATGKATHSCERAGCSVEEEYTLPALNKTDYTVTNDTATCAATGTATYTYNKDGVEVSFTAASPVNSDNHTYDTTKWVSNGAQHWHEASCEHKIIDNAANVTDLTDHTNGADGYCTACYTTSLTLLKNSFTFVAGNGIKFTAFIYGTSGDVNSFTYKGTATVQVEYGGYDDQGIYHSDKVTLSSGGTTTFDFTLAYSQGAIYITSDSAEQVSGTITRPAELGENANTGFPVTPTEDGEPYEFEGVDTPAGNKFQYVMTADSADAEIYISGADGREKITLPYKFRLADGVKKMFYMSYADGSSVSGYSVLIDREWDEGSVINPTKAEIGTEENVTVAVGDEYYCGFLPAENGWYKISSATEKAVLIAGSKAEVGAGQVAQEEKYGTSGKGFTFYVNIKDKSLYSETNYYKFRIASLDTENELACNFVIEKVADPTALELGIEKKGNTVYTFIADASGPDYMITVSGLPTSGYWSVTYEKEGVKTVETLTSTVAEISPVGDTEFTVVYENSAGSVILAEDNSSLYISYGVSAQFASGAVRCFRVPADGTYSFKSSLSTTIMQRNGCFWKINGQMYQVDTVTLENLHENDVVTIQYPNNGSKTTVTVLPEDNLKISATTSTPVPLNAGSQKLLYFTGTAEITYTLTLTDGGVQFVGGGKTKNVTADAQGNVLAFVEYIGEGESATVNVGVEQVPVAIQLGATSLAKSIVYSYTATVDGNYTISGISLGKTAGRNNYFMVNGEKAIENTTGATASDLTYTIENVRAGDVITFSCPIAQADFSLSLATTA